MKHRVINLSNSTQDKCGVDNCDSPIKRSVSRKKVNLVHSMKVSGRGKKTGLCKSCYRIFKKATKKDRSLESLGR